MRLFLWIVLPAIGTLFCCNFALLLFLPLVVCLIWFAARTAYCVLVRISRIPARTGNLRHQATMAAICVVSLAITTWLGFSGFPLLRYRMASVISQIETFRAEKGGYPEEIKQLVPEYLPAIPGCSPPGYPLPMYYFKREDSFMITCHIIGFGKASFEPSTGWYSWD